MKERSRVMRVGSEPGGRAGSDQPQGWTCYLARRKARKMGREADKPVTC